MIGFNDFVILCLMMLKKVVSLKYILPIILSVLFTDFAYAKKNKRTWDYPLNFYDKFEVKGSKNAYNFTSELRKDASILKEIENNNENTKTFDISQQDLKRPLDFSDQNNDFQLVFHLIFN